MAFLLGVVGTLLICRYAAGDRDRYIFGALKSNAYYLYMQNLEKGNYQEAAYYIRKAKGIRSDQEGIYEAGFRWGILYPLLYVNPYSLYIRNRYGVDEVSKTNIDIREQAVYDEDEKKLQELMKKQPSTAR